MFEIYMKETRLSNVEEYMDDNEIFESNTKIN